MSGTTGKFLIVAGTTKSATSSLYYYLSEHPEVAVTLKKECGYWLDHDYDHFSKNRFVEGSENRYENLFDNSVKAKLNVDVTPDYMYSNGTLDKMMECLKGSYYLFVLREPISRLVSWYNYSLQLGFLEKGTSLNDYVEEMFEVYESGKNASQYMQVLGQGKYGDYIEEYRLKLKPNQFKVVYYDNLSSDVEGTMTALCNWCGIDGNFYTDFEFERKNETKRYRNRSVHSSYHFVKRKLGEITMRNKGVHAVFKSLRKKLEPSLLRLNTKPLRTADKIDYELENRLIEFYREDVSFLNRITNVPLSWKEKYALDNA